MAGYQTTEDKPLMVNTFEPTGQGPSNAGLVGMPGRSLFVEQAADPEELDVDDVELDEVELDELRHCAKHVDRVMPTNAIDATTKISSFRTDFLSIDYCSTLKQTGLVWHRLRDINVFGVRQY